ncbi:MAG: hypothetical protein CBD74_07775 [Saprospirales bacterium TMED214]|nr:MAG: hypothetical protein CBD74_07775 [Saprospirales bacterium TMED214]
MTYTPRIDDYVKWNNIEGWVYFVDDEYITIEIFVKDKPDNLVTMHKKVHCLILCHWHRWHELEYVKSRSVTN